METEIWRAIPGFEGFYEASDQGRVRSLDRITQGRRSPMKIKGRILVPDLRGNTGYYAVKLSKNGVFRNWYVHRLVLMAFCGLPDDGAEACHGNDIRTDNRLSNLRWDTHRANVEDAFTRGRLRHIGFYNGERTHCQRNHPFDEENTLIRPGGRSCRTCMRMMERARYHAKKAQ